ncbi:hypothetical protein FHS14_004521 [Paenibacillus baekrokdamisoli]|uniref:hypothetical protein n=1 Tax=Paenibacillus baekrokdamisoli TaxID=1712516 RepID=UPI000F7B92DC|nr:hypothetical protein [Paenibacillus baekrokdamisoli]MBB3071512.1 hypothetical protein [Paenibacillus baekrokdamisoli]
MFNTLNTIRIQINKNTLNDEYIPHSEIPSVLKHLDLLNGEIDINLTINKIFNNNDYEGILQLINIFRNEFEIIPNRLTFWFKEKADQQKTGEYIKDFTYFDIYKKDFNRISTIIDIEEYKR